QRQRSDRRHGDRASLRVSLHVSIKAGEGLLGDVQRLERAALAPLGQLRRGERLPLGLREREPTRAIDKPRERLRRVVLAGLVGRPALAGDRHAERNGLLTLPDVAAAVLPCGERRQRSRLDAAGVALEQREQLI